MHHKDGNPRNNDFANLQILCPNCHSQTENYCSKNRKKVKERFYCSNCGKELSRKTITGLCKKCFSNLEASKSKCPSKEQLLSDCRELKSYYSIASKYSVSDKTVKKWCTKFGFTLKDLNLKKSQKPSSKNLNAIRNKYSKPVYQFDLKHNFIREFKSIAEASKETKVSKSNIRRNVQNKRLTAGGFV